MSKRKHYDQEFKLNAVKYYLDNENSSVDERAEHLGVSRSTLLNGLINTSRPEALAQGTMLRKKIRRLPNSNANCVTFALLITS